MYTRDVFRAGNVKFSNMMEMQMIATCNIALFVCNNLREKMRDI